MDNNVSNNPLTPEEQREIDEQFLKNVNGEKEEVVIDNDTVQTESVNESEVLENNENVERVKNEEVKPIQEEKPKKQIVITTEEEIEREKQKKNVTVSSDTDITNLMGDEDRDSDIILSQIDESFVDDDSENKSKIKRETVTDIINERYEDDDSTDKKINIEIIEDENTEDEEKEIVRKNIQSSVKYYGGKDKESEFSYRQRISSTSKTIKDIEVIDTSSINATDITSKRYDERELIMKSSIAPLLNPVYTIVPLVVSGLVVSMSAMKWTDALDLLIYQEELGYLDENDPNIIYEKNRLHLKNRHRQIEMFYKHLFNVVGYKTLPSFEEFKKMVKYPDLQQLFFSVYSSTFPDAYKYEIDCGYCSGKFNIELKAKDLCFYLNKAIDLETLSKMITRATSNKVQTENNDYLKELQDIDIVKNSNKVYRSKEQLPETHIIPEFKIPSIQDYLDSLEYMIEIFRNKPITNIDFNLNSTQDDLTMRSYLYINSFLIPTIKDKDNENVKVVYHSISDKNVIIDLLQSLSLRDYRTLMNNVNLQNLSKVQGIRHAVNVGKCPHCGEEIENIPIESETLFFMTALLANQKTQNI